MERDNKILVSAILIISIALFASSLPLGISGKAVKRDCSLSVATVSPSVIYPGDTLRIDFSSSSEATPGADYNGIELPVYLNRAPPGISCENGERVDSFRKLDGCNGNTCDAGSITVKTFSKEVSGTWLPGQYCVTAIDRCTQERRIFTTFNLQ